METYYETAIKYLLLNLPAKQQVSLLEATRLKMANAAVLFKQEGRIYCQKNEHVSFLNMYWSLRAGRLRAWTTNRSELAVQPCLH